MRPVYVTPLVVKARSCPTAPRLSVEVPEPPPPPAPPAARPHPKRTRVVIRRADGTAHVVETQTETGAKDKF